MLLTSNSTSTICEDEMRKSTALKLTPVEPLETLNPLVVVGSNSEPMGIEPTPYEKSEKAITDLYDEAALWLDGATVNSQDLADGITNLKNTILKARKEADDARDAEKRPFLEAGREVDARYKPLLQKADLAVDACKKANAPWLKKLADLQAAQALAARLEADRKREEAQAALRATDNSNLAEREAAEALLVDAKKAEADANWAEKAKPLSGGAVGRRDGLRTVYSAVMVDPRAALNHFAQTRREELVAFLQSLADKHVSIGQHTEDEIPGFKINSEQVVR